MQRGKYIFISLLFAVMAISCRDRSSGIVLSNPKKQYINPSIELMLKKFNFPAIESLNLDSNTLIFVGVRTFDTSFLLYINQGTAIGGLYYEILPEYHPNIYSYASLKNELLFFEGYSFVLEKEKWDTIKTKAYKILMRDSIEIKTGCCDGEEYGLFMGGFKRITGNLNYKEQCAFFYALLKSLFLDEFLQKRKPTLHRK